MQCPPPSPRRPQAYEPARPLSIRGQGLKLSGDPWAGPGLQEQERAQQSHEPAAAISSPHPEGGCLPLLQGPARRAHANPTMAPGHGRTVTVTVTWTTALKLEPVTTFSLPYWAQVLLSGVQQPMPPRSSWDIPDPPPDVSSVDPGLSSVTAATPGSSDHGRRTGPPGWDSPAAPRPPLGRQPPSTGRPTATAAAGTRSLRVRQVPVLPSLGPCPSPAARSPAGQAPPVNASRTITQPF